MAGKHILFLVHGMGVHKTGWSKGAVKKIKAAYDAYVKSSIKFDDRIEIKEIVYDNVFEDYREKWKNDTDLLKTNISLLGLGDSLIDEIVELASVGTGDDFFATHILDVLMYKLTAATVGQDAAIQIANQIIKEHPPNGSQSWSVLAYSLGTAATYQALHRAYTDVEHPLRAEHTRPNVVMMVANVSRILHGGNEVYNSPVRPGSVDGNQNICGRYCTVRNLFDPIPKIKPFDEKQDWPSPEAVKEGRYKAIKLKHIRDWNVHDLGHYLDHPRTTIELFRGMFHENIVSASTEEEAVLNYRMLPPPKDYEKIAKQLSNLTGISLPDFVQAFVSYLKLIKKGANK